MAVEVIQVTPRDIKSTQVYTDTNSEVYITTTLYIGLFRKLFDDKKVCIIVLQRHGIAVSSLSYIGYGNSC